MKPKIGKNLIAECKQRGYVQIGNVFYPPYSQQVKRYNESGTNVSLKNLDSLKTHRIKSGWIDDYRNLKNKNGKIDMFMKLIDQELGLTVWSEFFFSTERLYRLDYAIPVDAEGKELKIGIEIDGGIWAKGKSGHSSGTGIKRDQQKSSLLASEGWLLLRFEPSELLTLKTLDLIKKTVKNEKNYERD